MNGGRDKKDTDKKHTKKGIKKRRLGDIKNKRKEKKEKLYEH